MKTALSIIGIVLLVFLVSIGGLIGFLAYEGTKLDASSKDYVDENVPPIIRTWAMDELIKRESPQFRNATTDEQLQKLFAVFNRLGPMKSYDGARGDANMNFMPGSGVKITARYIVNATFEKGNAEVTVNLVRVHDSWLILGFKVDSAAFVN